MLIVGRRVSSPPLALVGLLSVLPALWLGLTALLGLGALLLPDRRRAALVALLALTFGLVWGLPWTPHREPVAAPIRLMAYNVQRLAFEDRDDGAALACVTRAVRAADPEVLILTELSARDAERLSAALDFDCLQADYTGSGAPGHGGLGVCIDRRRWTFARRAARRFTDDRAWYYLFTEIVERTTPASGPAESVGGLSGPEAPEGWGDAPEVAPGQRVFNVLASHLHPYRLDTRLSLDALLDPRPTAVTTAQREEAAALLRQVEGLRDPTILAGDFNSARDTALHLGLRRVMRDAHDVAAWGPDWTVRAAGRLPLKVDYIYATPDIAVAEANVGEADCSDHRPITATVGLPAPSARGR